MSFTKLGILNFFFIIFSFTYSKEGYGVKLESSEKKWIQQNRDKVIEIGVLEENNLFFYRSLEGKNREKIGIKGVYPDFFNIIANETGLIFRFHPMNKEEYGEDLKNNQELKIYLNTTWTEETGTLYNYIKVFNFEKTNYNMAVYKSSLELGTIIDKYRKEVEKTSLLQIMYENNVEFYKTILKERIEKENLKEKYEKIVILLPADKYFIPFYRKIKGEYVGYIKIKYDSLGKILGIPVEFVTPSKNYFEKIPFHHIKAISFNPSIGYKQLPSFYNTNRVVIGKTEGRYISGRDDLDEYRVGVKSSNILEYPLAQRVFTYEEGINKIVDDEIDYIVGEYRILSSLISELYLGEEIKILGIFPERINVYSEIVEEYEDLIDFVETISLDHLNESQIMKMMLNESKVTSLNTERYELWIFMILFSGILIVYFYILNKKLKDRKKKQLTTLIEGLDSISGLKDEVTHEILGKIGDYCEVIGKKNGSSKEFLEEVKKFSTLSVLDRAGEDFVKKLELGKVAENIVKYHNEHWNGKGYPLGLSEEAIPLEARIVAFCKFYEEIRIKEDLTHEEGVEKVVEQEGKKLDPNLVKIFLEVDREFEKIYDR